MINNNYIFLNFYEYFSIGKGVFCDSIKLIKKMKQYYLLDEKNLFIHSLNHVNGKRYYEVEIISFIINVKNLTIIKLIKLSTDVVRYNFTELSNRTFHKIILNRNCYKFQYLNNVNEDLKEKMVKNNPQSIEIIKNPSEKLQIMAVSLDLEAFFHIRNTTYNVQKLYQGLKSYD